MSVTSSLGSGDSRGNLLGAIFRPVSCIASGTTLTSDLQTGTGVPVVYILTY